ncbi:MAG: hypothetical protein QOF60_142 [Actinomycetota bacterium]|jgi:hypothetical protein|nr:hypothetical protein [Actinomycetota bacterium]
MPGAIGRQRGGGGYDQGPVPSGAVLFEKRFWAGLIDGSVTVTFRRWKARQVVAGKRYRSPAGFLDIDAIDVVDPNTITHEDAQRSGYPSAAALRQDLRGDDTLPTYRIEFHRYDGPDPREQLASDDAITDDDVAEITRRLARLDRANPWTRQTLELVEAKPAVRAGDLANEVGREMQPFKLDVRKLKNLGLTISLDVGYRLSPRGQAYLEAIRRRA